MTPKQMVKKLRDLHDKAERGVSYGFEQTVWRDTADMIERLVKALGPVANHKVLDSDNEFIGGEYADVVVANARKASAQK